MIKHGKNVPPTLGRTVKEASAICRSFLDGVVIFNYLNFYKKNDDSVKEAPAHCRSFLDGRS